MESSVRFINVVGFGILFLLIYGVLLFYPTFRVLFWLISPFSEGHFNCIPLAIALGVVMPLIALCFMALNNFSKITHLSILQHISIDYMISCAILLPLCLIFEIIYGTYPPSRPYSYIFSAVTLGVIILYILFGTLLGMFVTVKDIPVHSNGAQLKLVHISDVHIGSRSSSFLRMIVNKVTNLKPDVVVITGDLFDSRSVVQLVSSDAKNSSHLKNTSHPHESPLDVLQPLEDLKAKYGVYFVMGNHDMMSGEDSVKAVLSYFPHITILECDYVDITISSQKSDNNKVRIIGIKDGSQNFFVQSAEELRDKLNSKKTSSSPSSNHKDIHMSSSSSPQVASSLLAPDTSSSTSDSVCESSSSSSSSHPSEYQSSSPSASTHPFTVLLHHRPHSRAWKNVMKMLDADLFLAGHTHKGQLVPIFPLVNLAFSPSYGLAPFSSPFAPREESHPTSPTPTTKLLSSSEPTSSSSSSSSISAASNSSDTVHNSKKQGHSRFMYINPGTGTWGTLMRTTSFGEITQFSVSS
ncbi:putative Calcineurin-like phosphoesterase [Monocercomonoides exilis]|uniref:putative Calcineurin-like phosphoesterase n=1 Tax=Monocercomonoides exilis TaxID=2049356 RepID=UPI003559E564|nr:putative Calcineurin-like phosphoesterase [Monocercomonoides exilis]